MFTQVFAQFEIGSIENSLVSKKKNQCKNTWFFKLRESLPVTRLVRVSAPEVPQHVQRHCRARHASLPQPRKSLNMFSVIAEPRDFTLEVSQLGLTSLLRRAISPDTLGCLSLGSPSTCSASLYERRDFTQRAWLPQPRKSLNMLSIIAERRDFTQRAWLPQPRKSLSMFSVLGRAARFRASPSTRHAACKFSCLTQSRPNTVLESAVSTVSFPKSG